MPLTPEEEAQLAAEEAAGLFDHDRPGGGSATGTLALPASPEAVVWSEFARLAREALDDLPVSVSVRTWDGTPGDDAVPTSADETPWLRFSPMAGRRERWATGNVWHCPILVHVDQITGLAVADSMNLQGILMGLVESSAFREAMSDAGASSAWFDEGGYGERPNLAKSEPQPGGTITAIGTITIDLYIEYED